VDPQQERLELKNLTSQGKRSSSRRDRGKREKEFDVRPTPQEKKGGERYHPIRLERSTSH